MELSQHQMQIFIGLIALLCAAFITLIFILIEAKNKQLRRLSREVKVRHEAEAVAPTAAPALVETKAEQLAPCVESSPSSSSSSRDWGQLLSVRRPVLPRPSKGSNKTKRRIETLPAGFHDGDVLACLVQSRLPISGLVVAIGASVSRTMLQSLLGPNDFAAPSGSGEFLLIYPGERGAQAQRKLSQIAEQLWEFQLLAMGSYSTQFSWGSVEVCSEPIDAAIASATERMRDTRRGRKILTMEARPEVETPLRRAI